MLREAVKELASATVGVEFARGRYLEGYELRPKVVAALNQQLISLERSLLVDDGLQYAAWSRSLYAGPDPYSGYACWLLPPLRYEIEAADGEGIARWQTMCADAVRRLASAARAVGATLAADTANP